jgi:hypothetical protein
MIKTSKPGKRSAELPVRRSIRRDPVQVAAPSKPLFGKIDLSSREWEIGLALIGIVIFALAINAILFGASATMGQ